VARVQGDPPRDQRRRARGRTPAQRAALRMSPDESGGALLPADPMAPPLAGQPGSTALRGRRLARQADGGASGRGGHRVCALPSRRDPRACGWADDELAMRTRCQLRGEWHQDSPHLRGVRRVDLGASARALRGGALQGIPRPLGGTRAQREAAEVTADWCVFLVVYNYKTAQQFATGPDLSGIYVEPDDQSVERSLYSNITLASYLVNYCRARRPRARRTTGGCAHLPRVRKGRRAWRPCASRFWRGARRGRTFVIYIGQCASVSD
jgi:hypothetical protein